MTTHDSDGDLSERLEAWAQQQTCGCGYTGLIFEWLTRVRPVGSFSLAGRQLKFSANKEPWIKCPGCGARAIGRWEKETE